MSTQLLHDLTQALWSPDRVDRNGEDANVVDGLYAIADAVHGHARTAGSDATTLAGSLEVLAGAVREVAHKLDDLYELLDARWPAERNDP
jgi:hypothetical protein